MACYANDILAFLRIRELQTRPWNGTSPQLISRRPLVDWLSQIREHLDLEHETLHLAVKFMDLFMDGHDIETPQLYFVALVSLLLAAKVEEKANHVPKVPALNLFVDNNFPVVDYTHLEIMILQYFDWKINLPTSVAFVGLLRPLADQCLHELRQRYSQESFLRLREDFDAFLQYFLDISLQDTELAREAPSILGSSILLSTRIALGLKPHWPPALQIGTTHSEGQLAKVTERLLKVYDEASSNSEVSRAQGHAQETQLIDLTELDDTRKGQRSPDDGYHSPMHN